VRHRDAGGKFAVTKPGFCPWGHELTEDNTYVMPSTGHKICRHCRRVGARGLLRCWTLAESYARRPDWLQIGTRDRGRPVW